MSTKLNCWEYKKCGREPGGKKATELGVCPAATNVKANTINDGRNGGRCCWVVKNTLCGGTVQGDFTQKVFNCMNCDFYKNVYREQHADGNYLETKEVLKRV